MAAVAGMIPALILGAGRSRRMGRPKLALAWGNTTVLGHVLDRYSAAGAAPIFVVTGAHQQQVREAAGARKVQFVHNPDYEMGDMLRSIQVGLRRLQQGPYEACLLAPADLPAIAVSTIERVLSACGERGELIIPSYEMRRGHPICIGRNYWQELLDMQEDESLRMLINRHSDAIRYVMVEDDGMHSDLDTFDDYLRLKP